MKKRFNSNQQFFWKANYYLKRKKIALESIALAQANDKSKKGKKPGPKKNMRPQYLTSPWMLLLVRLSEMNSGVGPSIDSREGKLFRRRFRIPYPVFLFLANKCIEQKLFGPRSCDAMDKCGRQICPLELKLLGI